MSSKRTGVFAVRGDVACSPTLGTQGGVCDAAGLSILPRTKNPVVIFPQGAVKSGEFPQLHLTQVILIFRSLNALFEDVSNLLYCLLDILHSVGCD